MGFCNDATISAWDFQSTVAEQMITYSGSGNCFLRLMVSTYPTGEFVAVRGALILVQVRCLSTELVPRAALDLSAGRYGVFGLGDLPEAAVFPDCDFFG